MSETYTSACALKSPSISDSNSTDNSSVSLCNSSSLEGVSHDTGCFISDEVFKLLCTNSGTKTELLVLLCVVRFTLGFKRQSCFLSKSFISRWTGVDPGNIKRGLSGLIQKKLILRFEKQKGATATRFELGKIFKNTGGVKTTPGGNLTLVNMTQEEAQVGSYRPQKLGQNDFNYGVTLTPKNKVLKKESFFNFKSKILEKYFCGIENESRFFPEKKNFERLIERKSESEIERAFLFLENHGTVGGAKKCPVPMAYLAKAIDRVLELAREQHIFHVHSERVQVQETRIHKQEAARQRAQCAQELEEAFMRAMPSSLEQERFIEEFIKKRFKGAALAPSSLSVKRALAIGEWAKLQSLKNETAGSLESHEGRSLREGA